MLFYAKNCFHPHVYIYFFIIFAQYLRKQPDMRCKVYKSIVAADYKKYSVGNFAPLFFVIGFNFI